MCGHWCIITPMTIFYGVIRMTNWIENNGDIPCHPRTKVQVRFKNDKHETSTIDARDVDWQLEHGDPVSHYVVVEPFVGETFVRTQQ